MYSDSGKVIVTVILLLVAGVMVLGCSPFRKADANADSALAEDVEIQLDRDDDGRWVELHEGQQLTLSLDSNPTTGYRWEIVDGGPAILDQVGEAEFRSGDSDTNLVGAGGVEVFRFKAKDSGQGVLKLGYRRPWEDAEPLETFNVQILVP